MAKTIMKFLTLMLVCLFAASQHAAGEGKTGKYLRGVGIGFSDEMFFFPKKPSSLDIDTRTREYFIGKEDGPKFHYGRSDTDVSRTKVSTLATGFTEVRWSSVSVNSEEYGVTASTRFATRPRLSLSLDLGHKEIEMDTFVETWYVTGVPAGIQWICSPNTLCSDSTPWPDVVSNPLVLSLSARPDDKWRIDLKMRRERIDIQDTRYSAKRVKLYSLDVGRKWGRLEAGALLERQGADRVPSNTHVEARAAYDFWRGAKIRMEAGYFSSGLPLAGHPLADLGAIFVFDYLDGGADMKQLFNPLYTQKIGYYTLGIDYVLKFK